MNISKTANGKFITDDAANRKLIIIGNLSCDTVTLILNDYSCNLHLFIDGQLHSFSDISYELIDFILTCDNPADIISHCADVLLGSDDDTSRPFVLPNQDSGASFSSENLSKILTPSPELVKKERDIQLALEEVEIALTLRSFRRGF